MILLVRSEWPTSRRLAGTRGWRRGNSILGARRQYDTGKSTALTELVLHAHLHSTAYAELPVMAELLMQWGCYAHWPGSASKRVLHASFQGQVSKRFLFSSLFIVSSCIRPFVRSYFHARPPPRPAIARLGSRFHWRSGGGAAGAGCPRRRESGRAAAADQQLPRCKGRHRLEMRGTQHAVCPRRFQVGRAMRRARRQRGSDLPVPCERIGSAATELSSPSRVVGSRRVASSAAAVQPARLLPACGAVRSDCV